MNKTIIFVTGALNNSALKYIKAHKILIFNVEHIDSIEMLELALYHANRAFEKKHNIAKDFAIEVMLYLAGTRQITIAKRKFGVNKNSRKYLIVTNDVDIIKKLGLKYSSIEIKQKITNPQIFESMALLNINK